MKTLALIALAACGSRGDASAEEQSLTAEAPLELLPEEHACEKARACELVTSSDYDTKDCLMCARWIIRVLDEQNYTWRPYVGLLDGAACEQVNKYAEDMKFFVCLDQLRHAWSRTHPEMR